jgi:hypothetical protein
MCTCRTNSENSHHTYPVPPTTGDPQASAQAALRKSVLQALVEPPKPSEDVPPARLPTKEEKELIKLSLSLENIKMQSQQLQQQSITMGDTVNAESMVIGEMGTASYLSAPHSHSGNPSHCTSLLIYLTSVTC